MGIRCRLFLILLFLSLAPADSPAAAQPPTKPVGYLIISNNLCIAVRMPARQISTIPGQTPLLIMLKDKETVVTIQGSYLMLAVPLDKMDAAIRKYHLEKLPFIE